MRSLKPNEAVTLIDYLCGICEPKRKDLPLYKKWARLIKNSHKGVKFASPRAGIDAEVEFIPQSRGFQYIFRYFIPIQNQKVDALSEFFKYSN